MNRQSDTPSPVVFPPASHTPKLDSKPSEKMPQTKPWQFDLGTDSVLHEQYLYQQAINFNGDTQLVDQVTHPFRSDDNEDRISSIVSSSAGSIEEQIVGAPFIPTPIVDPISERSGSLSENNLNRTTTTTTTKKSKFLKKLSCGLQFFTRLCKKTTTSRK